MFDDRNRVVGVVNGEMRPGKAVRLTIKSRPADDRRGVALRGQATLRTSTANAGTQRILTLELVNDRTLEVASVVSCPLAAYDPRAPSGPVGYCGCHVVNDLLPAS
jgi:hypothetical protein